MLFSGLGEWYSFLQGPPDLNESTSLFQSLRSSCRQEVMGYAFDFESLRFMAFNVIWMVYEVKHGGRLTHTDVDFRNADFFFCDGMNDSWLKQYVV